jgi:transcriptional regulator with GAF, ATPase, and Fis domain
LDEIGELAPELQPKLLRVLESREFRRVGGDKMLTADVRVIAATTRKLAVEARRGTFRDDLYYRLAVVTLDVPPLRAHAEDIPLLATKLLESAGATPERAVLDEATATALRSYEWPGNVRELRNVLDRALHLSTASGTAKLRLVDFPPNVEATDDLEHDSFSFDDAMSYREVRARHDALFEHRYVRWLLERHGGNVAAAARAARMDRNHLTDLASKYGLERRRRTKR